MSELSCTIGAMAQPYLVPDGAPFAYNVAGAALDEQLRRIEVLDSKAGILIAADGVLAGLLFGRLSLILAAPRALSAIVVGLVVISLLLGLIAFANRRYRTAPHPAAVLRLMAAPEAWLRWRFLGNLQGALLENEGKLTWKARYLTAAQVSLFVGVALGGYFILESSSAG
jgi:hypothetical protein